MKRMLIVLAAAAGFHLAALSVPAAPPSLAKQLSKEISGTVAKIMPSVVVIRTEATRYLRAYDWFGRSLAIPETLTGQGSGVIIDKDGHILTSSHVVQGASEISVVLSDETELTAKVVGLDPSTDLAVLKVEKGEDLVLKPIEMGNSEELGIGELVIAVGSPFSLQSSVTLGIVSQKGRSVGMLPFEDFIQTDAPINPGNSGGPLINLDGQLVGINAMIQTGGPYSQGNIGIGFAVPVNLARRAAESIIQTGVFVRPWLGIRPREVLAAKSRRTGQERPAGIMIAEVFANTPATRAGLQPGDIITGADAQPLKTTQDLQKALLRRDIGKPIELDVYREGRVLKIKLTSEKMPAVNRSGAP